MLMMLGGGPADVDHEGRLKLMMLGMITLGRGPADADRARARAG